MNWAIIGCKFLSEAFMPVVSPNSFLKSTVSEAVEGCMPSATFCFGYHDPRVCTALLRVMFSVEIMPDNKDDNLILVARTSAWMAEKQKIIV
jgi:hypothetical protein